MGREVMRYGAKLSMDASGLRKEVIRYLHRANSPVLPDFEKIPSNLDCIEGTFII